MPWKADIPFRRTGYTVYYRTVILFTGYMHWKYEGKKLLDRYPKHVRYLGMQNLDITAAVWWQRNHKTYLFSSKYISVYCKIRCPYNV